MKVRDHRLTTDEGEGLPFRKSPNVGSVITPNLLVMHFTAGSTAAGSIDWLCNPESKVSAHVMVARDGTVTQLVAFNRKANHAGRSEWGGRRWCNGFAIGIEMDNAGKLERKRGAWVSSFGKKYPAEEVLTATHKNEDAPAGWHRFTPEQLRSAREVAIAIVRDLGITTIVGHEDISPGRKNDPGPAFPMDAFRKDVLARAAVKSSEVPSLTAPEEVMVRPATGVDYVVLRKTHLRHNPSSRSKKLAVLAEGMKVRQLPQEWWFVEVVTKSGGRPKQGWVPLVELRRIGLVEVTEVEVPEPTKRADGVPADRRVIIALKIVDFEARRDSKKRIAVYSLPSGDGGGSYEIAGINQRYHPQEAARLRELINGGRQDEAEKLAAEYIAAYTDVVSKWTSVGCVEAYLRDCAFNRGPGGAAKILQIALGVEPDGQIGPITREALAKAEENPEQLLEELRAARETYELRVAGRRPKFWNGLVNRWNNALEFARTVA